MLPHVISLLVVIIATVMTFYFIPDLRKDEVVIFTGITGYATIYGVIFAILEVMNAKNTAQVAKEESEKVYKKMDDLYGLRDITQCLASIEMAIESINKNEIISSSVLLTISKIYSSVFHEEMNDDSSDHRKNRALLQSCSHHSSSVKSSRAKNKLREVLLDMSSHLSCVIGTKTSKDNMGV
ncbi:hypothetical protein [Pseudoalteromonas sp. bablab_jr010]|uniref:hypothetical protein n=1 Tax=Pseudoalteromonas sp. bablab_jr010 TaxID=2755063 RepID=UPI0018F75996|nr:hypothetical protein [Pseudoalteromonas sp. bablab_jr010]